MNFLSQLNEDDVRYICTVVPYQDTITYFRKNPKEFAKIRPGFRAKAISKETASELLFGFRSKPFISHFIEKHITDWLTQIKNHYDERIEAGNSRDIALLQTLPYCFFAGNIPLYFKLANEECSEEYMTLMSAAIKTIKEQTDEQDRLNEQLKSRDSDIRDLNSVLISEKSDLNRTKNKLNDCLIDVDALKNKISELEKQTATAQNDKQKIASLENEIQSYEKKVKEMRAELSEVKNNRRQLEEQIRKELDKKQAAKAVEQYSMIIPKRPSNLDEFKEYLDYNLANIGVPAEDEYYSLLKVHLTNILFQGIPIMVNRATGLNVIKCIANTLTGQPTFKTLVFNKNISAEEVNQFLISGGRIVCLDNFIGNFNETELLPMFKFHRDKIIFLTVPYDRTIHYISREFLRYCHHLNINRIKALSVNVALTEDPSTIAEVDIEPQWASTECRYSTILREILRELGFPKSLIEQKCTAIFDEQDLCRLLAFDVLPYCVDVLQIAPYNASERLLKYAGDTGRCPYKKLFKEWFAL